MRRKIESAVHSQQTDTYSVTAQFDLTGARVCADLTLTCALQVQPHDSSSAWLVSYGQLKITAARVQLQHSFRIVLLQPLLTQVCPFFHRQDQRSSRLHGPKPSTSIYRLLVLSFGRSCSLAGNESAIARYLDSLH